MFKNLIKALYLLSPLLLVACGSDTDSGQTQLLQSDDIAPSVSIAIPDRIRTSQVVNLDATQATVSSSAGPIPMTRIGDQFTGSITVAPGSEFTFTVEISENVGGENIAYARATGRSDQPITQNVEFTLALSAYTFPDDDNDGFDNIEEREAGSDHNDTFSTPINPEGQPPTEATPGLFQFATDTFSVSEADGGLTISVVRTGGNDGRVTVNYQLNSETAIIGSDFEAASGQLVFENGDSTPKSFFATVLADDQNDGAQTFTATLFSPTGGASIGNGFARITINDSTPAAQRGTIQLVSNSITVNENTGTVQVTAERVNGSDGIVTVDFITTAGTATAEDFTAITEPGTLTWADGEDGLRTINIPLTNDTEVEDTETFTVNLINNIGGAALGLSATSVLITDTTPAPDPEPAPDPGQIAISQNAFFVNEGGSISIDVNRLNGSDGVASVDFTVTGGTADENDFSATNGTLNWIAGDSNPQSITINASADALPEANETVIVTLQNAVGAPLGAGTAIVTIVDASLPTTPGTLAFTTTAVSIDEGSNLDITVARNGGSDGAVSVNLLAPASAEYTISPVTLSWVDGESTSMTISIAAASDEVTGDTETFTLQLTAATGGATLGADTIAITIDDTTVVPVEPTAPVFTALATDGEWEVCIPPFNPQGPSAFAAQLSANEGRVVSCIKTCDDSIIPDPVFAGFGFSETDEHSCTTARDAVGTYTAVPIYTPARTAINLTLDTAALAVENSIWGCAVESRQSSETAYVTDGTTLWYQFFDDGTYQYEASQDSTQPSELLGPDVWSANGRILELGHINTGYRNTLFLDSQSLQIYLTTDDRLNCTLQARTEQVPDTPVVVPPVLIPPAVISPVVTTPVQSAAER